MFAAAAPSAKEPHAAGKAKVADSDDLLPDPKDLGHVDPKEGAQFSFLQRRGLEAAGIPANAANTTDQSKWGPKPAPWAKLEGDRAADFDARFGRGSYRALIRFTEGCRAEPGCERLATADLIAAVYGFIDLKRNSSSGAMAKGSPAYIKRDEELSAGMREAIELFRPKKTSSKRYRNEFTAFAEPVLKALSRER